MEPAWLALGATMATSTRLAKYTRASGLGGERICSTLAECPALRAAAPGKLIAIGRNYHDTKHPGERRQVPAAS